MSTCYFMPLFKCHNTPPLLCVRSFRCEGVTGEGLSVVTNFLGLRSLQCNQCNALGSGSLACLDGGCLLAVLLHVTCPVGGDQLLGAAVAAVQLIGQRILMKGAPYNFLRYSAGPSLVRGSRTGTVSQEVVVVEDAYSFWRGVRALSSMSGLLLLVLCILCSMHCAYQSMLSPSYLPLIAHTAMHFALRLFFAHVLPHTTCCYTQACTSCRTCSSAGASRWATATCGTCRTSPSSRASSSATPRQAAARTAPPPGCCCSL